MDKDRLEQLKQRTARASAIADLLEKLEAANPYGLCARVQFSGQYKEAALDESILKQVIDLGRKKMMADLEAELATILAPEVVLSDMSPPLNESKQAVVCVNSEYR